MDRTATEAAIKIYPTEIRERLDKSRQRRTGSRSISSRRPMKLASFSTPRAC
jgi:hypothetical protein